MKSTFDKLDCESPEEVAHPVAFLLTNYNFDKAFDGFLLQFLREWYDALPKADKREFERWLNALLKTTDTRPESSLWELVNYFLLPLLQDWQKHLASTLEHYPAKELASWKDVETLDASCQRYANAFLNDYFVQRPMNRSWLENIVQVSQRHRLPVLAKLRPEAIASQLCADSKDDLDLVHSLSIFAPPTDENHPASFEFELQLHKALFANYRETFEKLTVLQQLERIRLWVKHEFPCAVMQQACSLIIDHFIRLEQEVMEMLDRDGLLTLMHCADRSERWAELPEPIRMGCFKRLCHLELPLAKSNSVSVSFLPDTEEQDPTRDSCFWLVRPDGELYLSPILDWLQAQSEEGQLEALSHLLKWQCRYSEVILEALRAVLQDFAARIHKLPIPAAYRLISDFCFWDCLDQNALSEVFLGRMRQVDASSAEDYSKYFSQPYGQLLDRDPFKALRRLLDALVVAKSPISEADLSFVDDLGGFYLVPTSSPSSVRLDPDGPAAWLMLKLFEWMLRYVTGAVWKEQGKPSSICGEGMDLDSIRRFWAEYCWKKLDLKKTAKRKDPAELTAEDYLEPRSDWRIAHLKSLGDLGEDLGNKAHRRIHAISEHDPDEEVRAVAKEVYHKTLRERMKSAENPFYSFIKVTMWFRIANRESLELEIDAKAATSNRNRELRLAKAIHDEYMKG